LGVQDLCAKNVDLGLLQTQASLSARFQLGKRWGAIVTNLKKSNLSEEKPEKLPT